MALEDMSFGVIQEDPDTPLEEPEELGPEGDEEDGIEPVEAEGEELVGRDDPEGEDELH